MAAPIAPAGAGPAGGLPTAPSPQGPQAAPAPEAAPQGPAVPDGITQVQGALDTIVKFALAQRDQGNPALVEAVKPLVAAIAGGQQGQVAPGPQGPEPQGIPQAVPEPSAIKSINA